VHLIAHALNMRLGNFGATVTAIDPVEADPVSAIGSLRALVEDRTPARSSRW
jgi:hypothetical protein